MTSAFTLSDSVLDRLLAERIIVLGEEVADPVANKIVGQLLLLAADDPVADITLYINSPGGSVTAGMAILDTMETIAPDVATVATGLAASMGQILLTCGAPGKRAALPRAQIMMHQPSAGIGGAESDVAIRAELLRRTKRETAELIAERSGQTVETIERDFERDRWFTAQDAQTYGLIDRVISR